MDQNLLMLLIILKLALLCCSFLAKKYSQFFRMDFYIFKIKGRAAKVVTFKRSSRETSYCYHIACQ